MANLLNLYGFNSLQTGTHRQTFDVNVNEDFNWVSIPFKRERTGRHLYYIKYRHGPLFQFPSNGKAQADGSLEFPGTTRHEVSIPFKRERTGRRLAIGVQNMDPLKFQFPSNGNAQADGSHIVDRSRLIQRFNSLQTGTHSQTHHLNGGGTRQEVKFQFPSNGNAQSDYREETSSGSRSLFQFPSNGNAQSDTTPRHPAGTLRYIRFNSLQTGTHSQTITTRSNLARRKQVSIPFKRERTVRLADYTSPSFYLVSIPFKRERTFRLIDDISADSLRNRFNSLQTGTHIQTDWVYTITPPAAEFQFPSNGNAHSDRPHFRPTGAVASERQNQTRSAQAFFYVKNSPKNPANPRAH